MFSESDFWINFMGPLALGMSGYWIVELFILFAHIWFGWFLVALFPFSFSSIVLACCLPAFVHGFAK